MDLQDPTCNRGQHHGIQGKIRIEDDNPIGDDKPTNGHEKNF